MSEIVVCDDDGTDSNAIAQRLLGVAADREHTDRRRPFIDFIMIFFLIIRGLKGIRRKYSSGFKFQTQKPFCLDIK